MNKKNDLSFINQALYDQLEAVDFAELPPRINPAPQLPILEKNGHIDLGNIAENLVLHDSDQEIKVALRFFEL